MRIVLQRVSRASVTVDGSVVGQIDRGFLLLVGVARGDGPDQVRAAADKVAGLRVFPDAAGKMNLSLADVGGAALVVSQFTLLGDASRGRRPSFTDAAPGPEAEPLVELFAGELESRGVHTERGSFGAHMDVELVNDGPVTLILEF
ncbi:MAG: D-aminoacyl-tRNA deacylase [Actinomycetes bacterium]|jgi:D-tyrosyl-tRNA(Tyr) deacylase|nr:MAG: D-tyrosyl-tRNA(Tyr) deacylase [Actinomycetota bacterium]